nr:MAG TPA: hypothetical protein [Caudoviricetes sp.]
MPLVIHSNLGLIFDFIHFLHSLSFLSCKLKN